ncbi:MAG: ATP-binding cassette domain-containing protein [Eubacterium sp.]|nr:ATP-binding cassette domain-containing protein [Eubacterium sp.]
MLVADNLVKSFIRNEKKGKKTEFNAVDGISLTAEKGEIVGILGPNGAGKTTLLRMLASLLKPTSGEVYLSESSSTERGSGELDGKKDDDAVTDTLEIKKRVGYLSGNTKLYGRLSVRELLQVFAGVYGIEKSKIPERIEEIEKLLNMSEFIDNRIEKLSTGQTQRASIARCLVHDPDIYIFDEPTLGLDIISSSAIIEFMKKEKERGKTVIYSTHYMEEAEYLCDRIIMLNKGKAITNDSPEELKKKTGASNMRDAFYAIIKAEGMGYEE